MSPPATDRIDFASTDERTIIDLAGRGLAPLLALGRYRYRSAHRPMPPLRHRSLLVLALPGRGEFAFDLDGAPRLVQAGHAIRVPPGHTYRTGVAVEPRGTLTWLIARVGAGLDAGELGRAVAVLAGAQPPWTWPAPPGVPAVLDRAFAVATDPRTWVNDGLLRHLLATAVLELAGALSSAAPPVRAEHRAITTLLGWIDRHLTEPVDAADLATRSGLSTSHFYQAFRRATGTTPKDYLLRRKIAYAHDWLHRDPAVNVSTVAHALGFSSSQHFATVYRRYHGASPSADRSRPVQPG